MSKSILTEALVGGPQALGAPKAVRDLVPQAREFILDEEASRHVGHFIATQTRFMLDHWQFAIPPFPVTYVQLPIGPAIDAIDETIPGAREVRIRQREKWELDGSSPDAATGFLITPQRAFVCVKGSAPISNKGAMASGFTATQYRFGVGRTPREFFEWAGDKADWWIAAMAIGSGTMHLLNDGELELLLSRFRIDTAFPGLVPVETICKPGQVEKMAGELRVMIALLLLLNQRHHFTTTFVPGRGGIYRGKRIAYKAHTTVNINLAGLTAARLAYERADRSSPRVHDVRGHFYHWQTVDRCDHLWPPVPTEFAHGDPAAPRWQCARCEGWRSWRKAHTRGSALVGVATHDYAVTSKGAA